MFPQFIADYYAANQELLWLTTLFVDLGCTLVLYRLFGKAGLQVAIALAILMANLQGPKLTIIFGLQTSLGVIFYSSIFFATDVLSENYGKAAANKAVRMGFAVSVIVLIMLSLALWGYLLMGSRFNNINQTNGINVCKFRFLVK